MKTDPLTSTSRILFGVPVVLSGTLLWSAEASSQVPTTAVGWGRNDQQQITAPVSVANALLVIAGYDHNLALRSDGAVVAWGSDTARQTAVPSSLSNVVGLAAGQFHNLALKKDGVVVAWGGNFDGQTTIPSGLSNVVAIAAGGHHSLALKEGGTVAGGGTIRLDKRRLPKD